MENSQKAAKNTEKKFFLDYQNGHNILKIWHINRIKVRKVPQKPDKEYTVKYMPKFGQSQKKIREHPTKICRKWPPKKNESKGAKKLSLNNQIK